MGRRISRSGITKRACGRSRTCWSSAPPTRSRRWNAGRSRRCNRGTSRRSSALSRQNAPQPRQPDPTISARGAHLLRGGVERDVTILATGTEVALAVRSSRDAGQPGHHRGGGLDAVLGSSSRQPADYRAARARRPASRSRRPAKVRLTRYVASEAGDRHDQFGASAPARLYERFGITRRGRRPRGRHGRGRLSRPPREDRGRGCAGSTSRRDAGARPHPLEPPRISRMRAPRRRARVQAAATVAARAAPRTAPLARRSPRRSGESGGDAHASLFVRRPASGPSGKALTKIAIR